MSGPGFDLTACDREPIHIPGAVQPHGVLLVVRGETAVIELAGGGCERLFGAHAHDLLGLPLAAVADDARRLVLPEQPPKPVFVGNLRTAAGELEVVAHSASGRLVLEFEPSPIDRGSTSTMADVVERGTSAFISEKAILDLCRIGAEIFREVTGFDRVMIYRFLPDETGEVVAEAKAEHLPAFLNQRYPASDIPRQARALYLRNLIRVIPDVAYAPAPLLSLETEETPLDMSDCHLRSVSPIHIQYLKNMGVAASASISIVRDGELWGLVACHHSTPRRLSWAQRTVCRLLGVSLSQRVVSLEEGDLYRARIRARASEDSLLAMLSRDVYGEEALAVHVAELMDLVPCTGVVVRRGDDVATSGRTPNPTQLHAFADWLLERGDSGAFATDALSRIYAAGSVFANVGSGVLAATISTASRHQILWFRAEQAEVIEWAGNPHKQAAGLAAPEMLTPRASFEVWKESVVARSAPWSRVEIDSAERVAREIDEIIRGQQLNRLNETLKEALDQRDRLILQKDHLLAEGDHRIRNNLQILSSTLTMQLRVTTDPSVRAQLEEALGRISAVALVHRRLHSAARPDVVELEPYVRELLGDLAVSLGAAWRGQIKMHLTPAVVEADVALSLGLVLTELVLNAAKYAYGEAPGPVEVEVVERAQTLRLTVRDWGEGATDKLRPRSGLGGRLITAMIERVGGRLERANMTPGFQVTVAVPVKKAQGVSG